MMKSNLEQTQEINPAGTFNILHFQGTGNSDLRTFAEERTRRSSNYHIFKPLPHGSESQTRRRTDGRGLTSAEMR
jgi:hypothetical protein